MLRLDNRRSTKIDSVFVIALFTMFAVTAFLLILIGAKQYQHTADTMDANYESRTISSYLTEKIRQNDSQGKVRITEIEGVHALALETIENDVTYITYIYYYDNALREIIVNAQSVFSLGSGQEIIKTAGFTAELVKDNLIKITVTTTEDQKETLFLPLHSNSRKEQP
ncbi:MAG: DUF4860 domain-containing protein [Agathobacter sp.]|nr:DUF4860 domain-containing protein [Agathobacter sp.]